MKHVTQPVRPLLPGQQEVRPGTLGAHAGRSPDTICFRYPASVWGVENGVAQTRGFSGECLLALETCSPLNFTGAVLK